LRKAHAGLQASDRKKAVIAPAEVGLGIADRDPELARAAPELPLEVARHDADYSEERAVDRYGFPYQRRIASVTLLPQPVAEHYFVVFPEGLLFRQESAAEKRLRTQDSEEARSYAQARNLLSLLFVSSGREIVAAAGGIEDGHVLKRLGLALKIPEIRRGDDVPVVLTFAERFPDQDQAVGIGERHRFQKSSVDHAENSGAGADAKRKCK
jgi:hypothetical protein